MSKLTNRKKTSCGGKKKNCDCGCKKKSYNVLNNKYGKR